MDKREKPGSPQVRIEEVYGIAISVMPPSLSAIRKVSASRLRHALGATLKHVCKDKEFLLMTRNNRTVGLAVPPEIGGIVREYRTRIRLALAQVQMSDILSRIEYRGESFMVEVNGKELAILAPVIILDKLEAARVSAMRINIPRDYPDGQEDGS